MKSLTGKRLAVVLPLFLLLGAAVPIGCKKEPVSGTVPRPAESGVGEQPAETNSPPAEGDAREQIGDGILASIANADELLRLADEGDEAAQLFLGEAFVNAGKTEAEKAKGVEWFRKAAENGNSEPVRFALALCHIEGRGTERNKEAGIEILRKLAGGGFESAKAKLAELGAE